MRAIDLHTHTCKSDGSYTPTELVDYAAEKKLAAVHHGSRQHRGA